MKAKDDIFRLVKAMSPGEKRLFRRAVSEDARDSNYTRLFDAIDKQNEYDEEKIRKKFAGEKFIRHLPSEKNYLLSNILKTLRNLPEDGRVRQAILLNVCEAEVLFSKGLFDLALSRVTRAIGEARKYEFFGLHLDLMHFERRIFVSSRQEYALTRLKSWDADFKEVLVLEENNREFVRVSNQVFLLAVTSGVMIKAATKKKYRHLAYSGVMKDRRFARSATAGIYFYGIRMGYAFAISDNKGAIKYSDQYIRHLLKHPHLIEKAPQNYISALSNHITILSQNKNYTEAGKWLKRLEAFPGELPVGLTPSIEKLKFQKVINHRIELLALKPKTGNIQVEVDSITAELNARKNFVSDYSLLTLHYNLGVLFFSIKNYSAALKELEYLLSRKKQPIASDFKEYARVLSLLVHFEKGNNELLPYLIRSSRVKGTDGIRQLLFDFILRLSRAADPTKLRKVYVEFSAAYNAHPEKEEAQMYFDFSQWLAGKLERK